MTDVAAVFGQSRGQGLDQVVLLLTALVLSSVIGLERELRQKSAGLRTHTLVGLGSALFVVVSKFGFDDVLEPGRVVLDPSRVAAQIVTGIGFLGAGLIFVRRDAVRGLTTAAVVWMTAAVGAACGAGLPVLAAVVTGAHLLVVFAYPPLIARLPRAGPSMSIVRVRYLDGQGVLRELLARTTSRGFAVEELATQRQDGPADLEPAGVTAVRDADGLSPETAVPQRTVELLLRLRGPGPVERLVAGLTDVPGVLSVQAGDADDTSE